MLITNYESIKKAGLKIKSIKGVSQGWLNEYLEDESPEVWGLSATEMADAMLYFGFVHQSRSESLPLRKIYFVLEKGKFLKKVETSFEEKIEKLDIETAKMIAGEEE